MTRVDLRRFMLAALIGAGTLGAECAHAPPATGPKGPNAQPDPDYPEVNCNVNNTLDCRPGSGRG